MLFSDLVMPCYLYQKRTSFRIGNDDVIVIIFGPRKLTKLRFSSRSSLSVFLNQMSYTISTFQHCLQYNLV